MEWVRKPKNSYSTLWVNGAYASNFDSTASFGSDQRLTLGNIIDGGGVPFLGAIAAMEIYIYIYIYIDIYIDTLRIVVNYIGKRKMFSVAVNTNTRRRHYIVTAHMRNYWYRLIFEL